MSETETVDASPTANGSDRAREPNGRARGAAPGEVAAVSGLLKASPPPRGVATWPSWLAVGILSLLGALPHGVRHVLARGASALAMRTGARERRRLDINLQACFPELDADERRALERRYRTVLFDVVLRAPLLWWGSPTRLERHARFVGKEHLDAALASGRPVVLLISHTAALDGGMTVLSPRYPLQGIYKPFPNPVLDWLVFRTRTRFGAHPFARGSGFRSIIRGLRSGRMLCYLSDEDLGAEGSVFAPFFGHSKATLAMLPRIVRATDAFVVPMATYYDAGTGAFEVCFEAPLAPYPGDDALANATLMNAAIERSIRARPEQYLWKLALFRTCPDGGTSRYQQILDGQMTPDEL